MVKAATEKPAKSKLLSAAKSPKKIPSDPASTKPKSQPTTIIDAEEVSVFKKAKGKRKSVVLEDESQPPKRLKKISGTAGQPVSVPVEKESQIAVPKDKRRKALKGDGANAQVEEKGHRKRKEAEDADKVDSPAELQKPNDKAPHSRKPVTKSVVSKTKSLKKAPSPSESDDEGSAQSDKEKEKENSFEEEDVHLFEFSTDDEDSSDDDDGIDQDLDPVEVSKLPTIAKDDAVVKQKLERAKRKPVFALSFAYCSSTLISHCPHLDRRPRRYLPWQNTTWLL